MFVSIHNIERIKIGDEVYDLGNGAYSINVHIYNKEGHHEISLFSKDKNMLEEFRDKFHYEEVGY